MDDHVGLTNPTTGDPLKKRPFGVRGQGAVCLALVPKGAQAPTSGLRLPMAMKSPKSMGEMKKYWQIMELSGSNWGIFHDFPWKWLPGYRFGLNQSLSQPVEHLGCTMALNGLLDNIPRRCFFPLNIGIVQWITVEETTSYIYIYILDIYVHKYIHCLLDVYIYI